MRFEARPCDMRKADYRGFWHCMDCHFVEGFHWVGKQVRIEFADGYEGQNRYFLWEVWHCVETLYEPTDWWLNDKIIYFHWWLQEFHKVKVPCIPRVDEFSYFDKKWKRLRRVRGNKMKFENWLKKVFEDEDSSK